MSPRFFFTKEDYTALCKKVSEIEQKVKEYTASVGGVVDSSGDAWHDNMLYYVQRMSESWSYELRKLLAIKRQAQVVEAPPPKDGVVRFGKTVKVLDIDSGITSSYGISSYMVAETESHGEVRKISYANPLGKLLLGARVGEVREEIIGGNKKRLEILEVEDSVRSQ